MAVNLAWKLSGNDLRIFLTTLESSVFSPKFNFLSGKHLKFGIFHLLGAFVSGLQDLPCFLGNRHMGDPVEFIGVKHHKI